VSWFLAKCEVSHQELATSFPNQSIERVWCTSTGIIAASTRHGFGDRFLHACNDLRWLPIWTIFHNLKLPRKEFFCRLWLPGFSMWHVLRFQAPSKAIEVWPVSAKAIDNWRSTFYHQSARKIRNPLWLVGYSRLLQSSANHWYRSGIDITEVCDLCIATLQKPEHVGTRPFTPMIATRPCLVSRIWDNIWMNVGELINPKPRLRCCSFLINFSSIDGLFIVKDFNG